MKSSYQKTLIVACRRIVIIAFTTISIYVIGICAFSDYIPEVIIAKSLPLSLLLVALAVIYTSIERNGI